MKIARKDCLWVCLACGKTAKDSYHGTGGWDESCMMNSVEVHESRLVYKDGRVMEILVAEPGEDLCKPKEPL